MTVPNSPSMNLQGQTIQGMIGKQNWIVQKTVTRSKDSTGGTFSVGYLVKGKDNSEAFMKATDIGLLRVQGGRTKLEQMTEAMQLQTFEREMLDRCKGRNMDRIVRALDYGEFEVIHGGVRDYVFFIVFEKADGDIRANIDQFRASGMSWFYRAAHNLMVAISQLHSAEISHNDIKPSNFLVFDILLQKLSDMGRATCNNTVGPWDKMMVAGDTAYSAPEGWGYAYKPEMSSGRPHQNFRRSFDIYMLGSLLYFLVTKQSINQVLHANLRPDYLSCNWGGDFDGVLPYLRNAHGYACIELKASIKAEFGAEGFNKLEELYDMILILTDVDPSIRGDPRNAAAGNNRLNLQRFISRCELLSKKLEVQERV